MTIIPNIFLLYLFLLKSLVLLIPISLTSQPTIKYRAGKILRFSPFTFFFIPSDLKSSDKGTKKGEGALSRINYRAGIKNLQIFFYLKIKKNNLQIFNVVVAITDIKPAGNKSLINSKQVLCNYLWLGHN